MINNLSKLFSAVLLSILFSVTTVNKAKAQLFGLNTYDENSIKLGLTLSPNLGWLRYENDYESGTKVGFAYGLLADIGFAQNYFFSTGLLINSINTEITTYSTEYPGRDISLKYAEIPLTLKMKSDPSNFGRYYGQFGFTTGLKVSGREKQLNSDNRSSISGDSLFRLGLQIGGGVEWALNDNMSILTGLSFNNGFTKAINHGSPKSSYLALNLGLFF